MNGDNKLRFGFGNAKLSMTIATFSLPAGHTCPFAKECKSMAGRTTGKIIDGSHCRFRCFAASQESTFPSVRNSRWHNFTELKKASTIEGMAKVIQQSLPRGYTVMRVHVSGDFFNEHYFLSWLNVAMNNSTITFYGYTKALPFLIKYKKYIPDNFRFTASKGGTCDSLIGRHHLRFADVVFSVKEAEDKKLEIDHDDSLAFSGGKKSFALLLHGTQPPATEASKAWVTLMRQGIGGYGDSSMSRNMLDQPQPLQVYITIKNGKIHLPMKRETIIFTSNPQTTKRFSDSFTKLIYAS